MSDGSTPLAAKDLTPTLARRILQSLGEAGTPPDRGVRFINVGTEAYLDVLAREYLDVLLKEGGATFKLVQAGFGGGKTHFLHLVREMAWERGYATALVSLSQRECPFDQARLVYQSVMREITEPPPSENAPGARGLPEILENVVENQLAQGAKPEQLQTWLRRTIGRVPVDVHAFRSAVVAYLRAYLDGDDRGRDVLGAYLRGEEVPAEAHRHHGIFESIREDNAFAMLRSWCQMAPSLGFTGTCLLFDEMDRVMSLTRRKKERLLDNLRELVDLCARSLLPGVLFLYAVPPEFQRNVLPDYPALGQRLRHRLPFSETHLHAPVIDLERLQLSPEQLLERLGERILHVFEVARSKTLDPKIQKVNARRLADQCVARDFEISHRRLFVKLLVQVLQEQANEERELTGQELDALLDGTRTELLDRGIE
ncbi:MAG: DUF2791 family P-loop domain-containing protein, partial [Planctomycetes bacterium]|nr:DUF2791 family P-loop domain-containing protein [Planctomycetota bacterium]